ncbi:Adiponectin receptor protein 1 [Boothiomyces macroporosus]|uniref:Adiponectin receptor protein 1 n=1 Tax=Boothiomyces macroporosus TaxID=261099 RepID=A0AAD5UMC9_9FUNG|nr:Adiponectin receptor protein 1 [Boothiomyces macroporosus]
MKNSKQGMKFELKMRKGAKGTEDMSIQKTISLSDPTPKIHWLSKSRLRFYKYEELPAYLQDNVYIKSGYRAYYSTKESWISFFHLHNESWNVWLHAFGFFVFVAGIAHTWWAEIHPLIEFEERFILTILQCCASYTMLFSSLFHLHTCISKETSHWYGCLDYSGISATIAGGTISAMYFLLHCEGHFRTASLILLGLVNLVGIVGPMFEVWSKGEFRTYRALLYIASGAFAIIPVSYFVIKNGLGHLPSISENPALVWMGLMVAMYLIGAYFYVNQIPER